MDEMMEAWVKKETADKWQEKSSWIEQRAREKERMKKQNELQFPRQRGIHSRFPGLLYFHEKLIDLQVLLK